MLKNSKSRLTAAGITTAACALAVAGVTAASAASPAGARPGVSGTEHFYVMTTSPTSTQDSAIMTGVFTVAAVDMPGRTVDTLKFPGGTVKLKHGAAQGKQTLNPKTCLFTASQTGRYTITGGTGRYAGISGRGTAKISILAVAARNSKGQCSQTLTPLAWQQVIEGSGPIHL
jgi:hypothetical protein